MAAYTLWSGASQALVDIYVYTHDSWGLAQADKYLDGFYACFAQIAAKKAMWRPIPAMFDITGYYTRYEHHYIYWKKASNGDIAIVAILRERMHQVDRLKDVME